MHRVLFICIAEVELKPAGNSEPATECSDPARNDKHKAECILTSLVDCLHLPMAFGHITTTELNCHCDLYFGLSPSSPCFKTTTFRGMALPSSSGAPTLVGPVDGAGLYRWTWWLRNKETMEKVQKIDRSYTAPSSKTFGDELIVTIPARYLLLHALKSLLYRDYVLYS
jgi:hypothetical protein